MELLVPITFFIGFFGVGVGLSLYLRYRSRVRAIEAILQALETNPALSPAQIEAIASPAQPPRADLRRGALLVAFAVGAAAFGLIIGAPSGPKVVGLAAFPGAIGVAYLLFYVFRDQRQTPEDI